jgi:erythromycin esterase
MNPTEQKTTVSDVSETVRKHKEFLFPAVAVYLLIAAFCTSVLSQTPVALESGKPIERELKTGDTQSFNVRLEAGQFFDAVVNQRGIDVVVKIFAPDGNKIAEIDSPNGSQGDEPIALEAKIAGTYRIEIAALEKDAKPGRYEIRINEIVSADAYAKRLEEKRRKRQIVIAWLKENAIPLKSVEAGNGFADLQPLKKIFKDARFVGLGEATHGTREFFQFKHRMLEFLVKEMGFRVFAIEASYSACENINDYIMGKSDDGARALDSQGFWTWNTEEVRQMIDWMRDYNKTVPADKKLKFVGYDIQKNETGKAKLLEYLKRAAPERVKEAEDFFKINEEETAAQMFEKRDKEAAAKFDELKNKYNGLFVFLELNGANLAAKSSRAEYEQMLELARVLEQYLDAYSYPDIRTVVQRDFYMADNLRRIAEREPAGTRFVIWAHNGHISAGDENGVYPKFGWHLRRFYGKEYYALGFSFNQGAFQSRDMRTLDWTKRLLTSFTVKPAPADSLDWFLAQTNAKIFLVDFRSERRRAEFNEWLAAALPMRSIGSGYAPDFEERSFAPTIIGKEFDGLFFIDTTTRARPNPSVKNVAQQ